MGNLNKNVLGQTRQNKFSGEQLFHLFTKYWQKYWDLIDNEVMVLGGSKFGSVFHSSKAYQMSSWNLWGI